MSVVSCFESGLGVIHLPFKNTSDLFVDQSTNTIWFLYKKVLGECEKDRWCTDEDEFGAACAQIKNQAFGAIETYPLPIRLNEKPTGADGAKRKILSTVHHGGMLICTLEEPYVEKQSWGSRNFIFAFEIKEKRWRLGVLEKSTSSIKQYPVLKIKLDEIPVEWSACQGEGKLVLDKDGPKLVQDSTPYHLDDWKKTTNKDKVVKNPVSKKRILIDEKRLLINYFNLTNENAKLTKETGLEKSQLPPFINLYAPGYKKMMWTIRYPVSYLMNQDRSISERKDLGWDLSPQELEKILVLDPNLSKFPRPPWEYPLFRFNVAFVNAVYLETPDGLLVVVQASRPAFEHWLLLIKLGDGEVHECDTTSQNCISFCPTK